MDSGATTSARSVLDKPLYELTEDDISQLTREDCRRYLKEKGMRRPSWNKSQAIQQVISLKSLLEPAPPSPASTAPPPPSKAPLPPPSQPPRNSPSATSNTETSNSFSSLKELSRIDEDGSVSASADDRGPNRTTCPEPVKELDCCQPGVDKKTVSPRSTDSIDSPVGQMTIFYRGKVNVYDGVPADRAQVIMHLAAGPTQLSRDETTSGYSAPWAAPSHLSLSSAKLSLIPPHAVISQPMIKGKMTEYTQQCGQEGNMLHEPDVGGPTNRQLSLQRYLEKKKDRGRFKSKKMESSSGLEIYVNHQIKTQGLNGQLSRSSTSSPSPTEPGQPHGVASLMENQSMNLGLSIDLNDKV